MECSKNKSCVYILGEGKGVKQNLLWEETHTAGLYAD